MTGHLPSPGEDCSHPGAHRGVPELRGTGQRPARLSGQLTGTKGSLPVDAFFWMRGIWRCVSKGGGFTLAVC